MSVASVSATGRDQLRVAIAADVSGYFTAAPNTTEAADEATAVGTDVTVLALQAAGGAASVPIVFLLTSVSFHAAADGATTENATAFVSVVALGNTTADALLAVANATLNLSVAGPVPQSNTTGWLAHTEAALLALVSGARAGDVSAEGFEFTLGDSVDTTAEPEFAESASGTCDVSCQALLLVAGVLVVGALFLFARVVIAQRKAKHVLE